MKTKFIIGLAVAIILSLCNTSCAPKPAQAVSSVQSNIRVSAVDSLTQIYKNTSGVSYDLAPDVPLPGTYTYTQSGADGYLSCEGQTFKLSIKNKGFRITRPGNQVNSGKEIYEIAVPTKDLSGIACYFQVTRYPGTQQYVLIVHK